MDKDFADGVKTTTTDHRQLAFLTFFTAREVCVLWTCSAFFFHG